MKYIPNAIKFGNQSKPSLLIISMIFEMADFDPKLNCNVPDFYEYWHSEQIKLASYLASYKYINGN